MCLVTSSLRFFGFNTLKNDMVTYSQRSFCFYSQFSLLIIIVSRVAIPHIDSSKFFMMKYLIRQVKYLPAVVFSRIKLLTNKVLHYYQYDTVTVLWYALGKHFEYCLSGLEICRIFISASLISYSPPKCFNCNSIFLSVNFYSRIHLSDIWSNVAEKTSALETDRPRSTT